MQRKVSIDERAQVLLDISTDLPTLALDFHCRKEIRPNASETQNNEQPLLVHCLVQIPANKKHGEVHCTHSKNKMEESIAIRQLPIRLWFTALLELGVHIEILSSR